MVLLHEDQLPIVQPDLNCIQREQGNIVTQLNRFAWREKDNNVEYKRLTYFLEREEAHNQFLYREIVVFENVAPEVN